MNPESIVTHINNTKTWKAITVDQRNFGDEYQRGREKEVGHRTQERKSNRSNGLTRALLIETCRKLAGIDGCCRSIRYNCNNSLNS